MPQARRKRNRQLKVRLTEEEHAQMQALARACSCSVPALVRSLVLGYPLRSTLDLEAIDQLVRLHADLGRTGGLFKLCLTQPESFMGTGVSQADLRQLTQQYQRLADQLEAKILSL